MDGSRVGLLVAAGVFLAFLLAKLRPRLARPRKEDERPPRGARAEHRVWARLRRLPLAAQRRIHDRLGHALRDDEDVEEPGRHDGAA